MGLIDRIQAKMEFLRLEQRYTRQRHRRSTFVSNAAYVDGEYVMMNQTPERTHNTPGYSGRSSTLPIWSASSSASAAAAALTSSDPDSPTAAADHRHHPVESRAPPRTRKSSLPWRSVSGFASGSSSRKSSTATTATVAMNTKPVGLTADDWAVQRENFIFGRHDLNPC